MPKLVGFLPDRTVAGILSAPGHYEGFGIESVTLDPPAPAQLMFGRDGSASSELVVPAWAVAQLT